MAGARITTTAQVGMRPPESPEHAVHATIDLKSPFMTRVFATAESHASMIRSNGIVAEGAAGQSLRREKDEIMTAVTPDPRQPRRARLPIPAVR